MADENTQQLYWRGLPISDAKHADDLERKAALYEFGHGLSRREAEKMAHSEYRKAHHVEAAGFHLHAMKAARATGSAEASKRHAAMYGLHMQALGYGPHDPVPPEVEAHARRYTEASEPTQFAGHAADNYLGTALGKSEDRVQAAAHHLFHMKRAQAAGDTQSAERHLNMYNKHVEALGYDPHGRTPTEVMHAETKVKKPSIFASTTFKPHPADSLLGRAIGKVTGAVKDMFQPGRIQNT